MRTWVVVAAVLGTGAAFVAYDLFAPKGDRERSEEFPDLGPGMTGGDAGATDGAATGSGQSATDTPLRQGTFMGADSFHFARGTVALHQAANGTHVLRFEGYDARDGPDVYLYLTQEAGARSTSAVEGDGVRLLVPGGKGGGQATVRGDFNLWLPAGLDVAKYGGVTIWCDDFNEFFGHAPLM